MPLEYPQPLVPPYGPFPAVSDCIKSARAIEASTKRKAQLGIGSADVPVMNLRRERSDLVGITRLYLDAGGQRSTSVHNGDKTPKPSALPVFCFCPGEDVPTVSWKVRNARFIASARLEIFSGRLDTPISAKDLDLAALVNGRTGIDRCTGGLPLDDVIAWTGAHAAKFPKQKLTAEYSPYLFRLTITKKNTDGGAERELYPSVAWTFAHVLVDSIEIEWGDPAQIPDDDITDVDPFFKARTKIKERELVQQLAGNPVPPAIDIHQARIDLVLECNVFAANTYDGAQAITFNGNDRESANHNALKVVWGQGPRIPIKARALIRKAGGGAASFAVSKDALGAVRFLWDWTDDPDKWQQWIVNARGGYSFVSRDYLQRCVTTANPGQEPRGSTNCPVQHGGKRGDPARPIFPTSDATTKLGYVVQRSGGRPWAAIGEARADDDTKSGASAVWFQPGPFPGDRYCVRVYLTSKDPGRDDKPDLQIADDGTTLAEAVEAIAAPALRPPRARTGMFEVYRRSDLQIIESKAGASNAVRPALLQSYQERVGVILTPVCQTMQPNVWNGRANNYYAYARNAAIGVAYGLVNPQPNLGLYLVDARTFAEFKAFLIDKMKRGVVHSLVRDAKERIGMFADAGGKRFYYLAHASITVGKRHEQRFEHVVVMDQDNEVLARGDADDVRRSCFSDLVHPFATAADGTMSKKQVRVRLACGGLHEDVTMAMSANGLARAFAGDATTCKTALEAGLANLVTQLAGQDHEQDLTVTITTRTAGDRRAAKVATWLDEVFQKRYATLDTDDIWTRFVNLPYTNEGLPPLSATLYRDQLMRRQTIKGMPETLVPTLRKQDYAAFDGIVYVYIDWLAKVDQLSDGGAFTAEARVVGYHMIPGTSDFARTATYEAEELFTHELGHAFWMPHAGPGIFADPATNDQGEIDGHVPHDTCLMNYDVDEGSFNFCAMCLLEMRGWKDLPAGDTRANAIAAVQREANGLAGKPRAWRLLRIAYLHAAEAAAATGAAAAAAKGQSARFIRQAIRAWGTKFKTRHGVAMLRSAIRGYKKAERVDEARELWDKLMARRPTAYDLKDQEGIFFDDATIASVVVLEGGAAAVEPVKQYVNLPAEPRFVDGNRVVSVERLGRRVRVKVEIRPARQHQFQLQIAKKRERPAEPWQDGGFYCKKRTYNVKAGAPTSHTTNDRGTLIVDVDVPDQAGEYRLIARVANGLCKASQKVVVARLVFSMSVVNEGRAQAQAFPDADLEVRLNKAYAPHGIEFVSLGREIAHGHPAVYADNFDGYRKLSACLTTVADLAASPCGTPFSPAGATYDRYRPYLAQVTFVDDLYQEARIRGYQGVAVDQATGPFWLPLTGRGGHMQAEVWSGYPADLQGVAGAEPTYLGRDADGKEWLIDAQFTPTGQGPQALTLNEVDAFEDDTTRYPGRYGKLLIDLHRFDNGGRIQGQLDIKILQMVTIGGVNPKDVPGSQRGIVVMATRRLSNPDPRGVVGEIYSKRTQFSATIHEIGHGIGMAPPATSTAYVSNGQHCHAGIAPAGGAADLGAHYGGHIDSATCVMFQRLRPDDPLLSFCDECGDYLKALDLSAGFV
jgi:hypothetical protein